MHVCVLIPALDIFKGGNHLPLFQALPDVQFTILTNSVRPADAVLPANVRVITLGKRLGSYYYGFADLRFAHAVLRAYPVTHPFWKEFDLLHLNQTLGPQLSRLKQTGVPVLYAIHHPVTADREVAMAETRGLERWRWWAKYFFPVRWQGHLCRTLPYVMTVSETVRQRLKRDYNIPTEKISVVANGVDVARFDFAGDIAPEFDIIAVGSFLHPRKGFRYLLEVYRALSVQGLRIADVGKRSREQRERLGQMKGVTSFGTVSDVKIITLIRRSSVLISTSLYEGFGLSLIEALACGRPAFAFDAGAVREVLEPVDPAFIVPLRDSGALIARVRSFLSLSAQEQTEYGQRYRAEVTRRYALKTSAAALSSLYIRVLNS